MAINDEKHREALSRLLNTQCYSLANYVIDASPWMRQSDLKAWQTLQHIVIDQKAMAARIADYVLEHYGRISGGEYPMAFTDTNDLSLDYLVGKIIVNQKHDIAVIERCVRDLKEDPAARALAEEALGAARGHLESLEELIQQPAQS